MMSGKAVFMAGVITLVGTVQQRPGAGQRRVTCFGQVRQTRIEVGKETKMLLALSQIEPTVAADLSSVMLIRLEPHALVVKLDLRQMVRTGDTSQNLTLQPGDMLWFPASGGPPDELFRSDVMGAILMVHRLTHDADPMARAMAALTIGSLGEAAATVVPHLVAALGQDPFVAREVVVALGMIGPAAKAAIPILEKLTEHNDPQIAERAKAALRRIRER